MVRTSEGQAKISVIIPVYNTEKHLERCLDSVLAQSFEDWECLLIDDGSTDRSGAICDRYAQEESRFRVFHTANGGASVARNYGIDNSTGCYIAFVDSDDTVEPQYLAELYGAVDERVELVVCGMKMVRIGGEELRIAAQGTVTVGSRDADQFVELNRLHLLYGPVVKLYRAAILKNEGIRFPPGIHFGEDLMFNFKYLEKVDTIAVVGGAYYNYMMASEGTLSTSAHSGDFSTNYMQWNIIRSLFELKGIDNEKADNFLSNRLWGIAYDTVMGRKLPLKEIKSIFDDELAGDLKGYDKYTIAIPNWLRKAVVKQRYGLIWLLQRRFAK